MHMQLQLCQVQRTFLKASRGHVKFYFMRLNVSFKSYELFGSFISQFNCFLKLVFLSLLFRLKVGANLDRFLELQYIRVQSTFLFLKICVYLFDFINLCLQWIGLLFHASYFLHQLWYVAIVLFNLKLQLANFWQYSFTLIFQTLLTDLKLLLSFN